MKTMAAHSLLEGGFTSCFVASVGFTVVEARGGRS
jgi:hypothetical protein